MLIKLDICMHVTEYMYSLTDLLVHSVQYNEGAWSRF